MTALPWLVLIVVAGLQQPMAYRVATRDMCEAIVTAERHDLGTDVRSAGCFLVEAPR